MNRLEGKASIVTGGGSGIGRGIALALARRGAPVVLAGRRAGVLSEVAGEVQALGGRAAVAPGDLTCAEVRQQLLHIAHAAFGPIHILANNAGALAGGALLQLNGAEIERAIATNLAAPIDLTRLALADLMHARGTVLFTGSTASHVPLPYASLYSATKAGLHAFCTSLRCELAPLGVHLLEVYPPAVATSMTAGMVREAPRWLGRPQSPEAAGERIVAALEAGRQEVQWGAGERLLILCRRFAPHLLARVLGTQRRRFSLAMRPGAPARGRAGYADNERPEAPARGS
jgi:short-subunit dehydrogenase